MSSQESPPDCIRLLYVIDLMVDTWSSSWPTLGSRPTGLEPVMWVYEAVGYIKTGTEPGSPLVVSLELPLVLEQYLFVLEGRWFILLKITGIALVRSASRCAFFPLIKGVRAQRSKPMPTTHFHPVPALPFLLFVCCLSPPKKFSVCGLRQGKGSQLFYRCII